jgi:hypothetical protein
MWHTSISKERRDNWSQGSIGAVRCHLQFLPPASRGLGNPDHAFEGCWGVRGVIYTQPRFAKLILFPFSPSPSPTWWLGMQV